MQNKYMNSGLAKYDRLILLFHPMFCVVLYYFDRNLLFVVLDKPCVGNSGGEKYPTQKGNPFGFDIFCHPPVLQL